MAIGYQEQTRLVCPTCSAGFEAPVWLILDAQEAPEAVEALLRDELNVVRCPSCGAAGPAGAPLLFHDALARRVIFAPGPGAAEHVWREQARDLHALLVGSIPEEQRRSYLGDVDIAQDIAGVAHRLRRAAHRRGPGDRETGRQGDKETGRQGDKAPPLLVAVEALLAANTPADLDAVLAAHPILLAASTDITLAQLADVAVEQHAHDIAESLREARAMLNRVAASRSPAPARPDAPEAEVTAIPPTALQDLLRAGGAEALATVAAIHPLLLRPEVDQLLAEQVEQALDDGNERLAHALEERREALAQLRAAGADAASLDEAIEALLVAEGAEALAEVLDRYPVLLDEAASQALWQFAAEASASGDEELARYAVECREMLRRVRDGLPE